MDFTQSVRDAAAGGGVSTAWLSVPELASLLESDPVRSRRCLDLWLTPREQETLAQLWVPKRRREWLAGRVAAKEIIRRRHRVEGENALRLIEISAVQDGPSKGKPFYRIGGTPGPLDLSISHSGAWAVAALAMTPQEHIGIDIEQIEARDESFEALALSEPERAMVSRLDGEARAIAVTQRWVMKEALSKALGTGLRLRFQRVTVEVDDTGPPPAPRFRFEPPLPQVPTGDINARLSRVEGLCVASVAIRPSPSSP